VWRRCLHGRAGRGSVRIHGVMYGEWRKGWAASCREGLERSGSVKRVTLLDLIEEHVTGQGVKHTAKMIS
jgi:hypothetical protein